MGDCNDYFLRYYRWRSSRQLFSFVCCFGLQWSYLTTIQLYVGFSLVTFILKCSMLTFTFSFSIYFNLKIFVTSHGKTYINVLTFNGRKRQLVVSHRQSAVSNLLVNVRRFHQTVRRFHQTVRRFQQTFSSMEKALVVTL